MSPLDSRRRPAAGEPEGALALFHGRGADENDLFPLLDALDPERRLLGVTARGPLALPPGGAHWYVLGELGYPEPRSFMSSYEQASKFLDALEIRPQRTVLGGFSIGLSGFVPTVEGLELDLSPPLPRVAIGHGTFDPVIPVEWGQRARALLTEAGADVLYRESPVPHTIDPRVVGELRVWLADVLE